MATTRLSNPRPSAVRAVCPQPVFPSAYWLGRTIGWAVVGVAGGVCATPTQEVAPLTK